MTGRATGPAGGWAGGTGPALALAALAAACLLFLFRDGLVHMAGVWGSPAYRHGYLIPVAALYLLWLRARDLDARDLRGAWAGIVLVLASLLLLLVGEFSAVFTLIEYGFVLGIWACVLAAAGGRGFRLLGAPLLLLVLMVPLPNFIGARLSAEVDLLSATVGTGLVRLAGYSVYLDGNVIDYSDYRLPLSEACAATPFLLPLLALGCLLAVLVEGRWWQRALLPVAVLPLVILLNAARVGLGGLLANGSGVGTAEAFMGATDGWPLLVAGVVLLLLPLVVHARLAGRGLRQLLGLRLPAGGDLTPLLRGARPNGPAVAAVGLLALAAAGSVVISRPTPLIPEHPGLARFPQRIGAWEGRPAFVDPASIDTLLVSDHLMSNYARPGDEVPVELWIAYYASQAKGASVHSPQACLPGDGWRMESLESHVVTDADPGGTPLRVNRVLISRGLERRLVYYWFEQRGRRLTNEYLVKWFIFWDGLTRNRTDGALVRLSTFVPDLVDIPDAGRRLDAFVRDTAAPRDYHLPGRAATLK